MLFFFYTSHREEKPRSHREEKLGGKKILAPNFFDLVLYALDVRSTPQLSPQPPAARSFDPTYSYLGPPFTSRMVQPMPVQAQS